MENKNREVNGKAVRPQVTVEMVKDWVKRDIASGAYFLTMLMKHPDVIDKIADELFARAAQDEQDERLLKETPMSHGGIS